MPYHACLCSVHVKTLEGIMQGPIRQKINGKLMQLLKDAPIACSPHTDDTPDAPVIDVSPYINNEAYIKW